MNAGPVKKTDIGNLAERDFGVACRRHSEYYGSLVGFSIRLIIAQTDIEHTVAFIKGRSCLTADSHLYYSLRIIHTNPVTRHTRFTQPYAQLRCTDIAEYIEIFHARYIPDHVGNVIGGLLQLFQVVTIYLGYQGTFYTGYILRYIIHNRLAETEYNSGIHIERCFHFLQQFLMADLRCPVFDILKLHMEFDIEKTGRIGTVVRPPGLREHEFYRLELAQLFLHLFRKPCRLFEVYAIGQGSADIDGAFVQLRDKFRTQGFKAYNATQ